jgi:hypothetical protein
MGFLEALIQLEVVRRLCHAGNKRSALAFLSNLTQNYERPGGLDQYTFDKIIIFLRYAIKFESI